MSSQKFFITGTDTGVGKTYVSIALLKKFNAMNLITAAMKPIASGCEKINTKFYNEDALALQQAASIQLPYDIINPFALEHAIAPHLAAEKQGVFLDKQFVAEKINHFLSIPADVHLIEGAGGWHVPLNNHELVSDLVKLLNIPVILVVAIKLGCINHAILTATAIQQMQIPFHGWIANCIDNTTEAREENIATLKKFITAPCLEVIANCNSCEHSETRENLKV